MSADQSQIVEILKVLAANPRIIIFDEATAALDRNQVNAVFTHVRALKAEGRSIIFITHRMDEVFEIADRVTVMRNGVTVMTRAMRAKPLVTRWWRPWSARRRQPRPQRAAYAPPREIALEVENLLRGKLTGVSFKLRRGEILGLGGLHGQGQSDLLRALFGAAAHPQRYGPRRWTAARSQGAARGHAALGRLRVW